MFNSRGRVGGWLLSSPEGSPRNLGLLGLVPKNRGTVMSTRFGGPGSLRDLPLYTEPGMGVP